MTSSRGARRLLLTSLLTLTAVALAACGGSSSGSTEPAAASSVAAAPVADLAGTSWTLSSFAEANGTLNPAVTSATATLAFAADGSVAGSTGCNRIIGTYAQDGSSLTITIGPMTKMACADDVTTQETAVVANLAKVGSFSTGTSLVLMTTDGASLLTYAPGLTSLAGTSWQATGVNNGKGALEGTAEASKITATFGADGQLSGSGGCNTYSGPFETSGTDQMTIGAVAATAMACEDAAAMQTEANYFAALGNVATYQIDGDTLTLRDASGAMQATFTRTA